MSAEHDSPTKGVSVSVSLDWYLRAVAALDQAEHPKIPRRLKEIQLTSLRSKIEELRGKLPWEEEVQRPLPVRLERRFHTMEYLTGRALTLLGYHARTDLCHRHYWFHYDRESRTQLEEIGRRIQEVFPGGSHESSIPPFVDERPDIKSYQEGMEPEAAELLRLHVVSFLLPRVDLPPELKP